MFTSETIMNLFPGILSFAVQDCKIAIARVVLIIIGFLLAFRDALRAVCEKKLGVKEVL